MYIKIKEYNIYYEKKGNGQKEILILPGWGETRKTFDLMINELQKKYTVYILDYPGFGNTKWIEKNLTIYDYVKIIKKFINKLKIKNPILITHSFGTRIAIILETIYKQKIHKLIIMDGAGIKRLKPINILKQNIYKLLKKLKYILPKTIKEKYQILLINIFGSTDYKNIPPSIRKTFSNIVNEDLTKLIKQINTETLIIWGENDVDTPLKDGIKMNKLIKNSGLIIIKKGTHFVYLNVPHYINTILFEFIK